VCPVGAACTSAAAVCSSLSSGSSSGAVLAPSVRSSAPVASASDPFPFSAAQAMPSLFANSFSSAAFCSDDLLILRLHRGRDLRISWKSYSPRDLQGASRCERRGI
jgi:hypothetical protein